MSSLRVVKASRVKMDRTSWLCVLISVLMLDQVTSQWLPGTHVSATITIEIPDQTVGKQSTSKEICRCTHWPDNFNTTSHFYADFTKAGSFVAPDQGVGVSWHVRSSGSVPCQVRGVLKLVPPSWATKLTVDMCFKDPRDWSFNLGDSVSNNGYGGNWGETDRCAEVHSLGNKTLVYRAVYDPISRNRFLTDMFYDSVLSGPFTVHVMKKGRRGDQVKIINYAGLNVDIYNDLLFAWDTMYLGMNRVVDSTSRVGTGLCFVNIRWEK